MRAARVPSIGTEYNAFLYAKVSADTNGMMLSVLSAMARMNLDPWQETAELTKLSPTAAAQRLTALIAAVPGGPSEPSAPGTIAARLVKLLPSQTTSILPAVPAHKVLLGVRTLSQSRIVMYVLFALIGLALAATWYDARRMPSPPPNTVPAHEPTHPGSDPEKTTRGI